MTAPAFNVVRGVMVLEEPGTRKTSNDWRNRISGVAHRLTKPTCSKCGGENFSHDGLCPNWQRSLAALSPAWWFNAQVVRVVRQRMLMQSLKESLAGEVKDAKTLRAEWMGVAP